MSEFEQSLNDNGDVLDNLVNQDLRSAAIHHACTHYGERARNILSVLNRMISSLDIAEEKIAKNVPGAFKSAEAHLVLSTNLMQKSNERSGSTHRHFKGRG